MAIKQSGWNPKKFVTDIDKRRLNNPQKIENAENHLRDWPTWNDDGAKHLNDTENGEGNAMIRQKSVSKQTQTKRKMLPKKTINELLNYRTKKR